MRLLAILLCAALTGCATVADDARLGVAADIASTGAALSAGAVEGNPLWSSPGGLVINAAARMALIDYLDTPDREHLLPIASAVNWGAAGNNIAIALGASTPLALAAGLAAGYAAHRRAALSQHLEALCRYVRQVEPNRKCTHE